VERRIYGALNIVIYFPTEICTEAAAFYSPIYIQKSSID